MRSKITNIDDFRPYKTDSVICLNCYHDWQAVYPESVSITDLECSNCKNQNAIEYNLITARSIIKSLVKKDVFIWYKKTR